MLNVQSEQDGVLQVAQHLNIYIGKKIDKTLLKFYLSFYLTVYIYIYMHVINIIIQLHTHICTRTYIGLQMHIQC